MRRGKKKKTLRRINFCSIDEEIGNIIMGN
jgi:hypothetical protein